jgi:hypothetical protein
MWNIEGWIHGKHRNGLTHSSVEKPVRTHDNLVLRKIMMERHSVVVIYCHLSKLGVVQTPRLCNLPSKSYSNNINVPYTFGNNLVKGSDKPFHGMPIKF